MIVWGGVSGGTALNDGARYNPTLGGWTAITTSGAPAGRYAHTAVWTGIAMITFGGESPASGGQYFNDTYSYQLPSTMYLYLKP